MRLASLLLVGCSPIVVDYKDPTAPIGDTGGLDHAPDITLEERELDLGVIGSGGSTSGTFVFSNDGDADLSGGLALSGEGFSLDTTGFLLEPGSEQVVTVSFTAFSTGIYSGRASVTSNDADEGEIVVTLTAEVGGDEDGDGFFGSDDCDDGDSAINPDATEIWYDGVDQDCSDTSDYDQDGDGHDATEYEGDDCDDTDAAINPDAEEIWYDGFDQDCSGTTDYDQDGDGHDAAAYEGDDCDDTDAGVNPDEAEVWYDDVDQNCDGNDDDQDGDGELATASGGADCDDADAAINTSATEIWYDDLDQNCDGNDDDQDGDGEEATASGGPDCDDTDAAINTSAAEVWYDDVDQNCDGNDDDQDGDGEDAKTSSGTDCDDLDATINTSAAEVWYDDVDQNCDDNDDDQDADGEDALASGGTDCDDEDASINQGATEIWYDGIDQDCDTNDDDQDGDGYAATAMGGTDCDDTSASVRPGAAEVCDAVDQDCDGTVDEGVTTTYYADADADGYGDASSTLAACSLPSGYSTNATDCDDSDNSTNPGAAELGYDTADNDCDTITDEMVAEDESSWTVLGENTSDAIGSGGVHAWEDLDGNSLTELVIASPGVDYVGYWYTYSDLGIISFHESDSAAVGADLTDGYLSVYGYSSNDTLGTAVALLGDVDADGDPEIAMGQGGYYNGGDDGVTWIADVDGSYGSTYAFYMDEGYVLGDDGGDYGDALDDGDFDGDGGRDLAAGAPDESTAKGRVYVAFYDELYWDTDVDAADLDYYVRGDTNGDHLGAAVALGELNNDGYDDLVACAPDDDDGGTDAGRCFVIAGAATAATAGVHGTSVSSVDLAVIQGNTTSDQVGDTRHSVDIGDFNNDGEEDLAIGAPGYDGFMIDGGGIFVYSNGTLSGTESATTATWLIRGDGALGTAVRFADVSGDGVVDLLGGATTAGASDQGVVYMLLGGLAVGTTTVPAAQDASWTGKTSGDLFGAAISEVIDLDADGRDDFAVAATGNDDGATNAGKVYVLPAYP